MNGKLVSDDSENGAPGSAEIEFALVLSRMIDSVKNDPEDLRHAIYELARYKLQEQFSHADAKDVRRSKEALERAINGVEDFSKRHVPLPAPAQPPALLSNQSAPVQGKPAGVGRMERPRPAAVLDVSDAARRRPWSFARRLMILFGVIVVVAIAVQQRDRLRSLASLIRSDSRVTTAQPAPAPVAVPPPVPPKPSRLLPTDYGVYALNNDALVNLEQLQGRPPDMRVAISAAITTAPKAMLQNGRPTFIVFRRDLGVNATDRADVRIIARVVRDFSPTATGGNTEDTWVMRNVGFPFRASPIPDSPDMFELHSENPELELTPGRYALALKTTSYEFSIAGTPVDPRHCLERVVSVTGTFYTECKKP